MPKVHLPDIHQPQLHEPEQRNYKKGVGHGQGEAHN